MIEYLVILKGHNKDLAKAELECLWYTYFKEKISLNNIKNVLYNFKSKYEVNSSMEIFQRITYTNLFVKKIFQAENIKDFKNQIKKTDLSIYNNKKFLVRIKKSKTNLKTFYNQIELSKPIWESLTNPQVSLFNPDIEFDFLFTNQTSNFIFTQKIFENKKEYLTRMPIKRPISMPYTLKSDMSRCAINLLQIKKGLVLDPFCGIGGILLEAYDMNFQIVGNDISWNDLKYFQQNFNYFFKNKISPIILSDSTKQFLKENTIDGIVTDIPYGKCSRKLGKDLYENFLKNAAIYLKPNKRIIIIYANFVEFKDIAKKYFNEILEIEEYINKSMTRKILVLENSK
ncbi:MAG: methyltransferase [Nanoarchaeota archaeon]